VAARSELVPAGPVRRHAAEHLARSRATAVHALSLVDVDLDRVERVRAEAGLAVDAFVARAVADALTKHPHLNASVEDDGLRVHRDVHLGLTVGVEGRGTVAPVVRSADGKRLRALAGELAALQDRARTGALGPDDLAGATFTVGEPETEPGLVSIPIIHQPQVAILALGGVRRRPVAVPLPDGGEAIAVHPVAPLALVWDHRAVDRAYASAFLASVRDALEARDWQAEL
jgi:2-oxoglutarate dehydrogenase E2 component (dihydrolipoamide succinyltransferase)